MYTSETPVSGGYLEVMAKNQYMLGHLQEVGTLMIRFPGSFLKKSFCKMLKLFPVVFMLMDMSMLWWITSGIGGRWMVLMLILLDLM